MARCRETGLAFQHRQEPGGYCVVPDMGHHCLNLLWWTLQVRRQVATQARLPMDRIQAKQGV